MLEIIATCIDDAIKIEQYGGKRIELVTGLSEGGLTPSYALIKNVVEKVSIPVNVMIRPHSKSFTYSKEDINIMIEDIKIAKSLGATGVVLGLIDSKNNIDEENLEKLLASVGDLDVTFHRAIDETKNLIESAKLLTKYPQIKRILTSGGKGGIMNNINVIREMVEVTQGTMKIMVGGGLTKEILKSVIEGTGTCEVHFGTAVRKNKSVNGDISEEKLVELVEEYRKVIQNK